MTLPFDRDMQELHTSVLTMFSTVEEAIHQAVAGLHARNADVLSQLVEHEQEVNRQDIAIEEACLKILTLHQPVASDLRRVSMVLKIIGQLERVGDLGVNIAERTEGIAPHPDAVIPSELSDMSEISLNMLHRSIDAFVSISAPLAKQVCLDDEKIDRLNEGAMEKLQEGMAQRPDLIVPLMHLFSATQHLKRVADHATNIAEDVVYMVEGEIIRHGNLAATDESSSQ